jgi:hypothetical protein
VNVFIDVSSLGRTVKHAFGCSRPWGPARRGYAAHGNRARVLKAFPRWLERCFGTAVEGL